MALSMKTLGSQTAKLVQGLHDKGRSTFTLDDAVEIVGGPRNIVSNLLAKAQKRGVVTRLKRGLYVLVPYELGSATVYGGNPLTVASRLLEGRPHYLSHGTAMAVHGMTRQPQILVTASCVNSPASNMQAGGTELRVVSIREGEVFGTKNHWTEDGQKVVVSDIERTIVDCLRRTDLCGGYVEIDAGTWMVRTKVNADRLVDYAVRLGIGAVIGRVGFLMDSCELGSEDHRSRLREKLTKTYHLLDPLMPPDGKYMSEWHLRLNVSREEIISVRST
ncbi:transcriptional regulator [Labrenzia sp. 011]|nr:transcriptional regulator [Labrenzia sp. 011]